MLFFLFNQTTDISCFLDRTGILTLTKSFDLCKRQDSREVFFREEAFFNKIYLLSQTDNICVQNLSRKS